MSKIVLDDNVLVGHLDQHDSRRAPAEELGERIRVWFDRGEVAFTQGKLEALFPEVLDVIEETSGTLNDNDAALVVLQQRGHIGDVATFDANLASYPGFRTIA